MRLTEGQMEGLRMAARHHRKAHVRVQALALYNLGRGLSGREVARLFCVSEQSICAWKRVFAREGVSGLGVHAGRGRKGQADARQIASYVLQSPHNFGLPRTRWTLALLAETVPCLRGFSPSGVARALKRAGLSYKRGQPVQHSPDPDYGEKKSASSKP